jgi:hypothetical protein
MTELETARSRLAEAEAARHRIVTGKGQQQVTTGAAGQTSMVTFQAADLGRLDRYIAELRNDIARLSGRGGRRPIYFAG